MNEFLLRLKEHASAHLTNIFYAALILVIGLVASRLASRWLGPILDRSRIRNDPLLKNFFTRSLTVAILVLTVISSLTTIGWDVRTFLAGLGITGIILGFGLRDTLSNFAAGLLLLIYRPFRAGELIEVEGAQGVVQELTIVNMQMVTTDGVRVIMPNSKVWGAKIINYSLSERRRVEMSLKVREEDAREAIDIIKSALAADGRILEAPATVVKVTSFADGAATLIVWAWTTPGEFASVGADEYLNLHAALSRAEIQVL
jgi:small conductance mechanosensitive channel